MRARFVLAAAVASVLAQPVAAVACPACAAGGLGDDPLTVKLVGAFLALPFVLALLLALAARREAR